MAAQNRLQSSSICTEETKFVLKDDEVYIHTSNHTIWTLVVVGFNICSHFSDTRPRVAIAKQEKPATGACDDRESIGKRVDIYVIYKFCLDPGGLFCCTDKRESG